MPRRDNNLITGLAIDPGQRQSRITFLEQVIVSDDSGESPSWVPGVPPFQVWAKIDPLSGLETLQAGQDIGVVLAEVTVNYNAGIKETMRFRSPDGQLWVIRTARKALQQNFRMILTCSSLGPDA